MVSTISRLLQYVRCFCLFFLGLAAAEAQPVLNTVVNGASFQSGAIAPGELLILSGSGLGPAQVTTASPGRLPVLLGGTRVLFDGIAAPLLYASATRLSVMSPIRLVPAQPTKISVEYQGVASAPMTLAVEPTAPGLLTLDGYQVAAINPGNTVNGPSNPAPPASVVAMYGTGSGKTSVVYEDGALVSADRLPVALTAYQVFLGGLPIQPSYVGGAPGLPAGIDQINFEIPRSSAAGHVPVTVTAGNRSSAWARLTVTASARVEIDSLVVESGVRSAASANATVSLRTPAPPEGVWVALAANKEQLSLPVGVFIPGGATRASVAYRVPEVSSLSQYSLSATLFSDQVSTILNVLPADQNVAIKAVTAEAQSVGIDVSVMLSRPAPVGGAAVNIASAIPGLIVPPTLFVPAGETMATVRLLYSSSQMTNSGLLHLTVAGKTSDVSLPDGLPGWESDTLQDGFPDLASIGVNTTSDGLILHARFRPGTFDPSSTVTAFSVDTDAYDSSGFPGTYPMGSSPLGMGADIVVIYGGTCYSSLASIYKYDTSAHLLRAAGELSVSSSPASQPGFDVIVPAAFLQTSPVRMRAVTWKEPSPCGFAGVNDAAPDWSVPVVESSGTVQ